MKRNDNTGKCEWEKAGQKYITQCDHVTKMMGRGWKFCPYCGFELVTCRRGYKRAYARKYYYNRTARRDSGTDM